MSDSHATMVREAERSPRRAGVSVSDLAEVDRVLIGHEEVAEAASFIVPHARLGEVINTAIVRRAGASVPGVALRRYARTWLPGEKVPRKIHFVAGLPKDAAGNVQRERLAETSIAKDSEPVALLRDKIETELLAVWRAVLQRGDLTIDDDFFASGGDTRLAVRTLVEAELIAGGLVPESILFDAPTVRELADCMIEPGALERVLFMPVRAGSAGKPLFFIDGEFGRGGGYFVRALSTLLGEGQAFYNLRPYASAGQFLPFYEEMAKGYIALIKSVQPKGPYRFAGHCNGGVVALEVAEQLRRGGDEVELIAMIEPYSMNARRPLRWLLRFLRLTVPLLGKGKERSRVLIGRIMRRAWLDILKYDRKKREPGAAPFNVYYHPTMAPVVPPVAAHLKSELERLAVQNLIPLASYLPRATDTRIVCFVSEESNARLRFKPHVWKPHLKNLEIQIVPGGHFSCLARHVEPLAKILCERLNPGR